jgi:hypothetical protein
MLRRTDEEHLEHAIGLGRSLYSCNVCDFARIHTEYLQQGRSRLGIVVCPRQRWSPSEQARRLKKLIKAKSAEEMQDTLEYLTSWG